MLIPILLALRVVAWIAACVLIADLISGLIHWAEDRYGSEHWWLVGPLIIAPNLLHHDQPRAFLVNGWWKANDLQLIAGAALLAIAGLAGVLTWQLALIVVLAAHINTVHQWAHRSPAENGRLITALQRTGLLQSRADHGRHHGGRRDSHYCALTGWLNPLLERIRLWRGLEAAIAALTGQQPRIDPTVAARLARG